MNIRVYWTYHGIAPWLTSAATSSSLHTHGVDPTTEPNSRWLHTSENPHSLSCCITRVQKITVTLLYYGRVIDSTIPPYLGSLGTTQSKPTDHTNVVNQLLNYLHIHPGATVWCHASNMVLHVHSDASYLSESNVHLCTWCCFFLSDLYPNPNYPPPFKTPLPLLNRTIYVLSTLLKNVMASASEAELGTLSLYNHEAANIHTTLVDMRNP